MTARTKLELAAIVIALGAGFYGFRTWLAEHDARIRAEQQIAAAQKAFDQAGAQIKQIQQQQSARDAAAQAAIEKLAAVAAAQKTPQQIAQWIPTQLGPLPAPIKSSSPAPTPENPAPATTFEVPAADLSFLRDQVAKCQEDSVTLSNVQAGLTSCKTEQRILGGQIQDLQQQNSELKGGTFWQRVKHDLKAFAIGAAIGAAAVCGSGHCK